MAGRGRTNEQRRGGGRTTLPGGRKPSGRYTAPTPRSVRHSPAWYPFLLLGLVVLGIAAIILNYVQALPASPTNWYTLGGLVAVLAAALLATRYR